MAYLTTTQLAALLKIRDPSAEQLVALERVIDATTVEIDAEMDRASDATALTADQTALIEEVALERATEHWMAQSSPFGLLSVGVDVPAERTARNSWERHAEKLAPLKNQWGLA
jgi:hypothetical protein